MSPKDLIDAQSCLLLRQMIIERAARIDELYPEVGSEHRQYELARLIHLTHEMGLESEGLFWKED